ncbi:MAG: ThuA domain-containing protein [Microbacterium pygmaeum]
MTASTTSPLRVTVWGENHHETSEGDRSAMAERYPEGMHGAIAAGLRELLGDEVAVRTATRDQPEHGLTDEVLGSTDVLTWWGHLRHDDVHDEIVEKVSQRVLDGMGLLVLHSAHFSKIFKKLMGTSCALAWRSTDDAELVWTVSPGHPIAEGIPHPIVIGAQEMYGEFFDIPAPDELIFISSFSGGEVFRSGCTWQRGKGRIFYFSPGDQDFPVYHHPDIKRVLANGVRWAAPRPGAAGAAQGVVSMPRPYFDGARLTGGWTEGQVDA